MPTQSGFDGRRLGEIPVRRAGIVQSSGQCGAFDEGPTLNHPGIEVMTFDLLPGIEASALPVVRNVFQVALDKRTSWQGRIIELRFDESDLASVATIEQVVGQPSERHGPQGG